MDFYRFSISWPRILPTGYANVINQEGLNYYKNLVDELLANGIEPFVTLYHWDHPEILEKMGGWTNEMMVEWISDYAKVVFKELSPKVKYFSTINEPYVVCNEGYKSVLKAPGICCMYLFILRQNTHDNFSKTRYIFKTKYTFRKELRRSCRISVHA